MLHTRNLKSLTLIMMGTLILYFGGPTGVSAAGGAQARVLDAEDQAPESRFPSVGRLSLISGTFICTGTLISEKHFLTADHCVDTETPANLFVRFQGEGREVTRIFHHPTVDAAILELATPVTTITPSPVNATPPPIGSALTLAGFGERGTGTNGGDGTLPPQGTIDQPECRRGLHLLYPRRFGKRIKQAGYLQPQSSQRLPNVHG